MKLVVTLCVALAAACGSKSRCEVLVDKGMADCVKQMTQKFYVDGKEAGQLMSDAEAKKKCQDGRAKEIARCAKWPKEVLECVELGYSRPEEAKLPKCQQILEDNYAKEQADR